MSARITSHHMVDSEAWSSRGRGLEKNIKLGLGLPIDAPWSAVLAADDQALDLDLVDLIAWRTEHAPGGLMNSQLFAERWRLRQLAKMCARLVEQTTGWVDDDLNTEPQMDLFT